jgi:hypothetical protein
LIPVRKNKTLIYSLEQKYAPLIDRVPINFDPKEKFADLMKQCCEEYAKNAKGGRNIHILNELLQKLFVRIFNKFKDLNK